MSIARTSVRLATTCAALLGVILAACQAPADNQTLTMSTLSDWLDRYGEAWETRNADAAAAIFSADATYQVTPYEEPHVGRDGVRNYWAGVTENQRNVQFEHEPLTVTGNTGIAHWSASFDVAPDGTRIELNGIFVLEFDDDGNCRRLREWWHLRSEAPAGQD